MPTTELPMLRPYLAATQDERDPRYIILSDRLSLGSLPQRLTLPEFMWLQLFDGEHSLRDIQDEAMRDGGGVLPPLDHLNRLVERLDRALFLDGPRFRERVSGSVREPACLGCYEANAAELRRQIERLFTGRKGPGLPRDGKPDGKLRAALVPHIDYRRGGHTFAWGFKEVFERSQASLFVIVGTSHYSPERFTLTRKDFKTPLGIVRTDQRYIDRLVAHYGDGLFDDELSHLPEHSIELEVVFLQWWYDGRRPIRIVPLVVGSFQDCVEAGREPSLQDDIRRMIGALRCTEAEMREPICYLISGDLAHLGPKFGDHDFVAAPTLKHNREQDNALLRHAEGPDPVGFFRLIAEEADRRRICGLPPTYTVLGAVRPAAGKLLQYDQYVHPRGYESVSFASVAFYRE